MPYALSPNRPDSPRRPDCRRPTAARLFPWFLLAFAAIRAVNLAAVQMPFNGWDELPHIAVAYFVHKTGRMPTPRTPMPRELAPFIEAHPHPTASLSMLRGTDARPYPGGDPACGVEPPRRFHMFLYQAQHGPLFYHLMAPFLSGPDPASLLAWADGGRLFNAGLLVATLFLWRRILGRILPPGSPLSWLPDGVLVLLSGFSYVFYNFVRFSNDALALFLGTAALALYVLWIKPREAAVRGRFWRYALLGLIAGLAATAKATMLPLAGMFGVMLLWRALVPGRGKTRRPRIAALACLAGLILGYATVAGPYHLESLRRYGQLTGMQEAAANGRRGFGPGRLLAAAGDLGYGLFRNPALYNATPHLAGWANLRSPDWINLGFKTALTGCFLALPAGLCRRQSRQLARDLLQRAPELPLLWLLCLLALLYHALHSTLRWGFPTTGAWYGMLSLPALFLFMLLGPALCGRRTSAWALCSLALLHHAAYLGGTYEALLAQETGLADFYQGVRIAVAHHALLPLDLRWTVALELAGLSAVMALGLENLLAGARALAPVQGCAAAMRLPDRPQPRRPAAIPGQAASPPGPDCSPALQPTPPSLESSGIRFEELVPDLVGNALRALEQAGRTGKPGANKNTETPNAPACPSRNRSVADRASADASGTVLPGIGNRVRA